MKNMFSCVWSTSSEDTRHALHSHGPVHENSLTLGLHPFAFRTTRNENLTATLFSPVQWKQWGRRLRNFSARYWQMLQAYSIIHVVWTIWWWVRDLGFIGPWLWTLNPARIRSREVC